MLRSIMEGVAFSLKDCLEVIKEMGVNVDNIVASGGGEKSRLWRQMQADAFGMDVSAINSSEGGALGVAILAGVGTGVFGSAVQACEAIITIKETTKFNSGVYDKNYIKYKSLYISLKDNFREE